MKPNNECSCDRCKSYCKRTGWFLPGEIEEVAKFLGLTLQQLFDQKLGIDWWVSGEEWCEEDDVFILAPATKNMTPGEEYPYNPKGECVFYKNELCEIHPVKPYECAMAYHTDTKVNEHEKIARAWVKEQQQIIKLLGHKPQAKSGSFVDLLCG